MFRHVCCTALASATLGILLGGTSAIAVGLPLPGPGRTVQVVDDDVGVVTTAEQLDAPYVGFLGGLAQLTPHMLGAPTIKPVWTSPLADVTAVAEGRVDVHGHLAPVVLDRASGTVLVLDPTGGFHAVAQLPAGVDPRAVAADPSGVIAVADAGSDSVRMFVQAKDGSWDAQPPIAVGHQPQTLTFGGNEDPNLYIADTGANAVTVLTGTHRRDIPIGGSPIALVARNTATRWQPDVDDGLDLNGDENPDVVVLDAAGRVTALLGSDHGPTAAWRITLPGGPASQPAALAFLRRRYANPELAVAAPGAHAIYGVGIKVSGRFTAPIPLATGLDAIALTSGAFGGDVADDLAYVQASGAIGTLITPGDRLIRAGTGLRNPTARDGRLVWSHRLGRARYELSGERDGAPLRLPTAASAHPLRPRLGRAPDGGPALAYVRCRPDTPCRAYTWSFSSHRERRLVLRVARGCQPTDVAVWQRTVAYITARTPGEHGCGQRTGLWIQTGRTAIHRGVWAYALDDLRGHMVLWDGAFGADTAVRIAHLPGRARTINAPDDCCSDAGAGLDGRFAYWWSSWDPGAELIREPLSSLKRCQSWPAGYQFPFPVSDGDFSSAQPNVAIDHGRVYYALDQGIFELAPRRLHWQRGC